MLNKSQIISYLTTAKGDINDDFIKIFLNNVKDGFLQTVSRKESLEYCKKLLLNCWHFLQNKKLNEYKIQVVNIDQANAINALVVLTEYKPFIVESLNITLQKMAFNPVLTISPILEIIRDSNGNLQKLTSLNQQGNSSSPTSPEILITMLINQPLNFSAQSLQNELEKSLNLLNLVVNDYQNLRQIMLEAVDDVDEITANFLKFLDAGNFTYLGARYFSDIHNSKLIDYQKIFGLFKEDDYSNDVTLKPLMENGLTPDLSILKSNLRSPVHRSSRLDCLEILHKPKKNGDTDSNHHENTTGLLQIIGLFSKQFFHQSPFDMPILQPKLQQILNKFSFYSQSLEIKLLRQIINSIPLDELFQMNEQEIYNLCYAAMNMHHNLVLNVRKDAMKRFSSIMVYMPTDHYSHELKQQFIKILENFIGNCVQSDHVLTSDAGFTRLIFILPSIEKQDYDVKALENILNEAMLSWDEKLQIIWKKHHNGESIFAKFDKLYQENFSPEEGVYDIENWSKGIDIKLATNHNNPLTTNDCDTALSFENFLIIKVYQKNKILLLSELIPTFENFGLKVWNENAYAIVLENQTVWCHVFRCQPYQNLQINSLIIENLTNAFLAITEKTIEDDVFNQLILTAELNFQQITLFRCLAKYLKQAIGSFSPHYIAHVLCTYPSVTKELWGFFNKKFQPNLINLTGKSLQPDWELHQIIQADHDKIIRYYIMMLDSIVRTNFYQNKPYISLKFACKNLSFLPIPVPLFEVFVYSPTMEGCHLRAGKVARGGIRWSDRQEDFRQEILGLMKAQVSKNSVIIPTGAKGGFVVKNYNHLPEKEKPSAVVAAYQTLIKGVLDLTDNLQHDAVQKPNMVKCYDHDDTYLVVAADKGTANFSDIANKIAVDNDFWLGDAFASGGSLGYNHKVMGITAKGAWISVQNHLQRLQINHAERAITTIGIGDMGGDVFGNGMLQSENIQLIAAFNHKHIFIDPTPDLKASFLARKKLFHSTNGGWDCYDNKAISSGGGVWLRSQKTIVLTQEVQALLQINQIEITPNDLIILLLQMPVDLLWFGGIGTFIKSSNESHYQVHDYQNDNVRIDADKVKAKIIAEGANLGITQKGRIEFALKGGLINTDSIDNSGGVDCSDHEVNIKIALKNLLNKKLITIEERNELLNAMTQEVTDLVLQNNHLQNQIITQMEKRVEQDFAGYIDLLGYLEKHQNIQLNRPLESLPNDEELKQRKLRGLWLTRPELAIILSYSKNVLYQEMLDFFNQAPNIIEEYYEYLYSYFPLKIINKFKQSISHHPLLKEIIATVITNKLVNDLVPVFLQDIAAINHLSIAKNAHIFFQLEKYLGFCNYLKEVSWENKLKIIAQGLVIASNNKLEKITDNFKEMIKFWSLLNNGIDFKIIPLILHFCYFTNNPALIELLHKVYNSLKIDIFYQHLLAINSENTWQKNSIIHIISKLLHLICNITMCAHEDLKWLEIHSNAIKNLQNLHLSYWYEKNNHDENYNLAFACHTVNQIEILVHL